MILRFVSAVLALGLAAAGCSLKVELDGPAGEQSKGDAGSPAEDPAHPDPGQAQELPPAPVFKDDFERANGKVRPPWFDVGFGTPQVWYGQLCLHGVESVVLELQRGHYGYARVDVNGGGFEWSLESRDGTMLQLDWSSALQGAPQIAASTGEDIADFGYLSVRSVEVLLEHTSAVARVRVNGGPWIAVQRLGDPGSELARMRFSFHGVRAQPNIEASAGCFDNVYAGPSQPERDPFADTPSRPGYFTEDTDWICLFQHCGSEILQCMEPEIPEPFTCPSCGPCGQAAGLVASCHHTSPDGSVSYCVPDPEDGIIQALVACADAHCASDITTSPIPPANLHAHADDSSDEPLTVVPVLIEHGGSLVSARIDLATGEQSLDATLPFEPSSPAASGSTVHLNTTWGAFDWTVHIVTPAQEQRVFARWVDLRGETAPSWSELTFGAPITRVVPLGSALWVETTNAGAPATITRQVLERGQARWETHYRRTDPADLFDQVYPFLPQNPYGSAYLVLHGPKGGRLIKSQGSDVELDIYVEDSWRIDAMYGEGFVYTFEGGHGSARSWVSLDNEWGGLDVPPGRIAAPYVIGWDDIWSFVKGVPTRLATRPAAVDRMLDVPVASDVHRVLYQTQASWLLADTEGRTLWSHEPAAAVLASHDDQAFPVAPARTVPISVSCGLLVSETDDSSTRVISVLDAYHVDEQGQLVTERLDVFERAADAVRVAARPGGLLVWQRGDVLRGYDCTTFTSYAVPLAEPLAALPEYPPFSPHTTPAIPVEPGVEP